MGAGCDGSRGRAHLSVASPRGILELFEPFIFFVLLTLSAQNQPIPCSFDLIFTKKADRLRREQVRHMNRSMAERVGSQTLQKRRSTASGLLLRNARGSVLQPIPTAQIVLKQVQEKEHKEKREKKLQERRREIEKEKAEKQKMKQQKEKKKEIRALGALFGSQKDEGIDSLIGKNRASMLSQL